MDSMDFFRQGLGSTISRPPQSYPQQLRGPPQFAPHPLSRLPPSRDEVFDADPPPNRIAHTLTACCRCRQRKTRCDPTLPRCLPCERSNSTCEYFDTAKSKKISRYYVVKLQDRVRQLESELSQFIDDDNEYPRSSEDILRPGGLVHLNETDETARYLGPSSGIAMTRLLMEEAKRYTESNSISELIPELRARRAERMNRMQSIVSMGGSISGPGSRMKSYPMLSSHPAESLPTRPLVDKLVEVFYQRAQVFTPALHEKVFARDLEAVIGGSKEPYQNFVVRMVLSTSLQKLDAQYAGLADSYYQSAMVYLEEVVRPKDLKTLQCLVLLANYSLLTPTRTSIYYTVGLATKLCKQLGLGDEKTIGTGLYDPMTVDMRRRLVWIVATLEYGLANAMGRPSGFTKTNDLVDVELFSAVDDEYITEKGILEAPRSSRKLVAMHYCKMRAFQAEIRRVLYEKKRTDPKNDQDPWFGEMERKMKEWIDSAPPDPAWCKPWFTGYYHSIILFMRRPTPQIPQPSSQSALACYESAAYVMNLSNQQVKRAAVDITWIYLLSLYMALNTLLWTVSYPEVRASHPREELEKLVAISLDIIDQCSERWPGAGMASQLYAIFAKACIQSYEAKDEPPSNSRKSSNNSASPTSTPRPGPNNNLGRTSMPSSGSSYLHPQAASQQTPMFQAPQFGYVFGASQEQMTGFNGFENVFGNAEPPHPAFRSNSIFLNPASEDGPGRRFSYFPPDYTQSGSSSPNLRPQSDDVTPPATISTSPSTAVMNHSPPSGGRRSGRPTLPAQGQDVGSLSPPATVNSDPTPKMPHASPAQLPDGLLSLPSVQVNKFEGQAAGSQPQYNMIPTPQSIPATVSPQQRPLPPANLNDWFSPPPPFISPYAFNGNGWGDVPSSQQGQACALPGGRGTIGGLPGVSLFGDPFVGMPPGIPGGSSMAMAMGVGQQFGMPFMPERQGSLSQEQQMELMDALETEGMGEINNMLNLGFAVGEELPQWAQR